MTYDSILKDLKNKVYRPIYFLMGDETYFIDVITDYIQHNILSEADKAFNLYTLYGKDVDAETIINTARRFPMGGQYQVVIVKEAQNVKNIEVLEHYANAPLKSTILVVNYKYKTLDKRKKLYKLLENNGVLFEAKKLYDNQVPEWIVGFLKNKGYETEPGIPQLLTEYLGNDLSNVSNALEKLMIALPNGVKKINSDHVEKNVGISKDYNIFELQKAIIERDILKANRIVDYFGKNPKASPFPVTISSLYTLFSRVLIYHFTTDKSKANIAAVLKVNPYFVSDYERAARIYNPKKTVDCISLLRQYDVKSKGVGNVSVSSEELLREMIFKILH